MFEPIGYLETEHTDPAVAPSQAFDSHAVARAVIDDRFVDGLLGLEQYPYVWLLTWLHDQPGQVPLRLVPRVKEKSGEIQGVFASRSPQRPSAIGLSLVRVLRVDGNVITFAGIDVLDGTPLLDIKPWFADCDVPPDLPRTTWEQ